MDREKPLETILFRELHTSYATSIFQPQLEMLREMVNYGTNLVASLFQASEKGLADIVLVPNLLKQVVSMLDGFEVLASNACVPAAALQARAMFEASVYVDFILLGEVESKAAHYYVANVRRELLWVMRTQGGTAENASFFSALGDFGSVLDGTRKKIETQCRGREAELREFLAKKPWSDANASLEAARGKKKHDVAWYVPFGAGSVRNICQRVERGHEYEVFYSASSEKMHSSEFKSHVTIGDGRVVFEPIRNLEGFRAQLGWVSGAALHTYRKLIERYRPGQLQEFSKRYLENWRQPFMVMTEVKYKPQLSNS